MTHLDRNLQHLKVSRKKYIMIQIKYHIILFVIISIIYIKNNENLPCELRYYFAEFIQFNLNTSYADTDTDLCIRIMSLYCMNGVYSLTQRHKTK